MRTTATRITKELEKFHISRGYDLQRHTQMHAVCGCGAELAIHFQPSANTEFVIKKFSQKGWAISHKHTPKCPRCQQTSH